MTDVHEMLLSWWAWSRVGAGWPKGYTRRLPDDEAPVRISDGEAELIEQAVLALKRRMPGEYRALTEYLRCGGNVAETARWTGESPPTVRSYVQRAESWIDGWLAGLIEEVEKS